MCDLWDVKCQTKEAATEVAGAVADSIIGHLVGMISDAQTSLITTTVTWWLYLPPVNVGGAPAARTLQEWMLPFAVLVAVGGIMWQSLLLIINRKGEPLVTVVKGLFTTAVWGAVSLTGTQLVLRGCEAYTEWVLTRGMNCAPGIGQDRACKTDALAERLHLMLLPATAVAPILVFIVGLVVLVASIMQAMLLLFRNGAIIILAGMLQLAASGTFTSATSNWLRRVLGWLLALTFYEPFAATCYAVAFMLIGDRQNTDISTWFTGVGMLGLSLIALPAMMRFFNWTVGAVQSTGNSAGMLAAAGAAGLHAMASQRGASGMTATDYARDMDRRYPPASGGGGGGADPPRPTPPTFAGPSPTAPAGNPTATTASTASTASTTSTTATTASAAGAGAAGAGAGAAGAGAVGASAAAGPAAPVVAGVVVGAKVAATAARTAADTAARSTEDR